MNGRYRVINEDGICAGRTSTRIAARLLAVSVAERIAGQNGQSAAAIYDTSTWTCETWNTTRRTWRVYE